MDLSIVCIGKAPIQKKIRNLYSCNLPGQNYFCDPLYPAWGKMGHFSDTAQIDGFKGQNSFFPLPCLIVYVG